MSGAEMEVQGHEIAVVGLAGRFPACADVEELWRKLLAGEECITFFSRDELLAAGVDRRLAEREDYVPAAGWLPEHDRFDEAFFDMTPREAEITDPQQRLFLECAWHAFEDAAIDPRRGDGRTAVFASASASRHAHRLLRRPDLLRSVGSYRLRLGNEKDFLPTWVAYKLGLRGPAVNVQTACSSSLVAVHLACQSLLFHECDQALAGGVSVRTLEPSGYLYSEGGINSPDGHCRPFDADAAGTLSGDGVGAVLLKRLADALEDGDPIRGVILGSAINNDGDVKVGFTAPSQQGQARVIREALGVAGLEPRQVGYVEAHGTGTRLGDPIEVAALTEAFGDGVEKGSCILGSVKSNMGHLDAAAGVTGLIKAVLSVERGEVPPSLHFHTPNPEIGIEATPFRVADERTPWPGDGVRVAAVSSFGIGGTNAHLLLRQPPPADPVELAAEGGERPHLVVVSGRDATARDAAAEVLADHLEAHPDLPLAAVAHTCAVGRRPFAVRRAAVGATAAGVAAELRRSGGGEGSGDGDERPLVFLFPGQGVQHPGMAADLQRRWPVFRQTLERCAELLLPELEDGPLADPLAWLHADPDDEAMAEALTRTELAQPVLFSVEMALADLWESWAGPAAHMLGHSLGEWVAACRAGVFSLPDALALVALRGRLMQGMPEGSMLAVPRPADELEAELGDGLSLAAVNAADRSVVSGPTAAIEALAERLAAERVPHRLLATSHAFHSPMMEEAVEPFREAVAERAPGVPERPFHSAFTGRPITPEEATDPTYWAGHLTRPVRFAPALRSLLKEVPDALFLEVGPGEGLSALVRRAGAAGHSVASLPRRSGGGASVGDDGALLRAAGRLWELGGGIDPAAPLRTDGMPADAPRLHLPGYPFRRNRHVVEVDGGAAPDLAAAGGKSADPADWIYLPTWEARGAVAALPEEGSRWLLFADDHGWADALGERLRELGAAVITVRPGTGFAVDGDAAYRLDPASPDDHRELLRAAGAVDGALHLWNLGAPAAANLEGADSAARFDAVQRRGFLSLAFLAAACAAEHPGAALRLLAVGNGMEPVLLDETLQPERSTVSALARVICQEAAPLFCRSADLAVTDPAEAAPGSATVDALLAELVASGGAANVALRGRRRWVPAVVAKERPERDPELEDLPFRRQGVYLITGGLGRVGLALAHHLAQRCAAKLVLTRRTPVPPREQWGDLLASRDGAEGDAALVEALQRIEEHGAVEALAADVTDPRAMARVVERAEERFGALHGVIHAAGNTGEEAMTALPRLDATAAAAHFTPKVHGLLVLDRLLADRDLDLRLSVSSLASVLGGLGFAAYAAANRFLDVWAARSRAAGEGAWTSIAWDTWRFDLAAEETSAEPGLTPAEGGEALERALAPPAEPMVAVSTTDLEQRLRSWGDGAGGADGGSGASRSAAAGDDLEGEFESEVERSVAEAWVELLGVTTVTREDDFFDLGADSLLATQLAGRLRARHRVELPVEAVFANSTLKELAARVEREMAGEDGDGTAVTASTAATAVPPIEPRPEGVEIPLSFPQQRLWFLDRMAKDADPYNTLSAFRLLGPLDVGALAAAFSAIVARHEVLRTVFPEIEGTPVQRVRPPRPVPLPVVDLSALPERRRLPEARRLARREGHHPFDLARGPLYRNTLLRFGPGHHGLLIAAHHIVCDGWSVAIYRRELSQHYAAATGGHPPGLPPLELQYGDYALWQRQWLQGEVLEEQLDYWREKLGDLPVLDLPLDHRRPETPSFRGGEETFRLSAELTGRLEALSRESGATLFMTLLAAFKVLLARWTGGDDVVVGSNIANRRRPELEPLIGFFVNNLVLRTDLSGDPTGRQAIDRVRRTALDAYAHQDVPFERLVSELRPERQRSRNPLFQVLFVLQIAADRDTGAGGATGGGDDAGGFAGLEMRPLEARREAAAFDLLLNMQKHDDHLFGSLEYNRDVFEPSTVTDLIRRFHRLLDGLVDDPDAPVSNLSLVTPQERERLVAGFTEDLGGSD